MHNIIIAEIMKQRKNRMFRIGTFAVVILPFLLLMKSLFLDKWRDYMDWIMTAIMLNTLVLPIASGFVLTVIVQKEYQDMTIRNILAAPARREYFVITKFLMWFLWHMLTFSLTEIMMIISIRILFPTEFYAGSWKYILYLFTQNSMFCFITMIPILWITLLQKTQFYPSMICILGIAVLQMAGLQVSEELLTFASICPWTAVSVSSMVGARTWYYWICVVSILLCGFIGFVSAVVTFKKQDQ